MHDHLAETATEDALREHLQALRVQQDVTG